MMEQMTADKHAREVAKTTEGAIHKMLVSMIRSNTLPDIGFLKLEEMACELSQATVNPVFEKLLSVSHSKEP